MMTEYCSPKIRGLNYAAREQSTQKHWADRLVWRYRNMAAGVVRIFCHWLPAVLFVLSTWFVLCRE